MNLIAVVDSEWGIGYQGRLLVHIPQDLRYFSEKTIKKVVIMGHDTLRSLPNGKPLKDRINIVLSRERNLTIPGAYICNSLHGLFRITKDYLDEDVFVIGGQSIYEQLLEFCKNAYITRYSPKGSEADRYFPDLDLMPNWVVKEKSSTYEYKDVNFNFVRYENDRVTERQIAY